MRGRLFVRFVPDMESEYCYLFPDNPATQKIRVDNLASDPCNRCRTRTPGALKSGLTATLRGEQRNRRSKASGGGYLLPHPTACTGSSAHK